MNDKKKDIGEGSSTVDIGAGTQEVEIMSTPLSPVGRRLKKKDKVDDIGEGSTSMVDIGAGSSMVVLNVKELEMSMRTSLTTMGMREEEVETKPCIYRVFPPVREQHGQDYDPQIIAIGPFHRDNKALKAMEPLKWTYLRQLINRNRRRNTLQKYIEVIGEAVAEARGYYSEQLVEQDDNEFVKMMVLDGGFLIEYLVKAYAGELGHLSAVNWNLPFFRRDLVLLENQFPFPILQRLFNSSRIPELDGVRSDGSPVTLTELAVSYVSHNKLESLPELALHHLLHVYHASIHPTPQKDHDQPCCGYATVSTMKRMKSLASAPLLWLLSAFLNCHVPLNCCGSCCCKSRRSEEKKSRAPRGIQTATQLVDSGVKFREKEDSAGSFLDVRFDKEAGVMEIPKLPIQEATISQFRNLIAFEQCCPKAGGHFTSHATLMNFLIDTPADVAILKDAHIIESKLGEDNEVAELFNNLCKGAYLDYEKHHNRRLFEDVVAYYNIDRHKWRAGLMHNYFSNPWAIISLAAAAFLLCLTVVQTFYAVYTYHRPPH